MLETIGAIVIGLGLTYAVLLLLLWEYARRHPDTVTLKDALRLLPDLLSLLQRLMADKDLPVGVRLRVGALIVYLLLPIDIVPDFIPVIGYADDAVIVALVLRSVVRRAGVSAVRKHWNGSDVGLTLVEKLAGIGQLTSP
jgi:uncharacterized membrane protein YkvA (DUF1232 family)